MAQTINGVVVDNLRETAARVAAEPQEAISRAAVVWQGGLKSAAQSRDKPVVEIDEPGVLGGDNSAATPIEMLLSSLGSCVISMIAAQAAHREVEIRSMQAEVEGGITKPSILGLVPTENPGFSSIRLSMSIDSPADPAIVREIFDFAVRRSPVGSTIARGTPIEPHLKL
jgi:uncharacterized OsmC-like protein